MIWNGDQRSDEAWRVKLAAAMKDAQAIGSQKTTLEKQWQQDLAAVEGVKRKNEEMTRPWRRKIGRSRNDRSEERTETKIAQR
jgi:hypothetical protein